MSLTDDVSVSPPQLLLRRFTRYLNRIDAASRGLTRRENYHLECFVKLTSIERWLDASEALRRAEQAEPLPAEAAHLPETNAIQSTAEFRRLVGEELAVR